MSLFPLDQLGSEELDPSIQQQLEDVELDDLTPAQIDEMDAEEYSDYLASHKEFDL